MATVEELKFYRTLTKVNFIGADPNWVPSNVVLYHPPSTRKTYRLDEIGREWNYATGRFETTQKQTQRILDFQRTGR